MEESDIDNMFDKLENIEYSVERLLLVLNDKFQKLDPTQYEKYIENINKSFEKFEKNSTKLNEMILELKGLLSKCHAMYNEYKDKTPIWYKIGEVPHHSDGDIWIKDIENKETLAKCKGTAIIYASNSSLKEPMYWKPI